MRFLSLAERELRAAARQKGFYRARWIAVAAAFALLLWLSWVFDLFQNQSAGPEVFSAFSMVLFVYCLATGAAATADALSRERREGTLGLLFLTNLNSAEILGGKLCAHALSLVYFLIAIFPMLALPVLLGGITFDQFWRTVLALLGAMFFAMSAGFLASAVSVRQFPAIALAMSLSLVFGAGVAAISPVLRRFGYLPWAAEVLETFCPLHTLLAADAGVRRPRLFAFWVSLAAVAGWSLLWLLLATWHTARTWRDRPKGRRWWQRSVAATPTVASKRRTTPALRRRFLDINPIFWLAARQRVSSPVFMLVSLGLVILTSLLAAPFFERIMGGGNIGPVVGHFFAWLWAGMGVHLLVLYYATTVASQRLAEDKQTGALELVLSTPTTEPVIARGLWLAYARRMFFPGLFAGLIHAYFIWICLTLLVLEAPSELPAKTTPGELFWAALFNLPIRGYSLDWHFGLVMRVLVLLLLLLVANWVMLGWVGRWLGLRMKHPGFAPLIGVGLAVIPPVVVFSLICYLGAELGLFRMPERQILPLMVWTCLGVGLVNCGLLSWWAASHLRRHFREALMGRFEPRPPGYWRQALRTGLKVAAALLLGTGLLALSAYWYQNWRSQRQWVAFQKALPSERALTLAPWLPPPVPDAQNFARSPAFLGLLNAKKTLPRVRNAPNGNGQFSVVEMNYGPVPSSGLSAWTHQEFGIFDKNLITIGWSPALATNQNRARLAAEVRTRLQRHDADLHTIAQAAELPGFQLSTNRTAQVVHDWRRDELTLLEDLHATFQIRAITFLTLGQTNEAAADVLTGLRLVHLARQSPDAISSLRAQFLLAQSLQPIWEGLAEHRWTDAQLAAMQRALSAFNLLADYTNALQRVTFAYVETWDGFARGQPAPALSHVSQSFNAFQQRKAWQPGGWWWDDCRQLYAFQEKLLKQVDATTGKIRQQYDWNGLSSLPLDDTARNLFQQPIWWGRTPMLTSHAQTTLHEAIVACALERWRLAQGTFPESLDELIPTYLTRIPADLSRGRPVYYERLTPQSFELRGGGQNEAINAGMGASDDWVWAYSAPTNSPAIPRGPRKR